MTGGNQSYSLNTSKRNANNVFYQQSGD